MSMSKHAFQRYGYNMDIKDGKIVKMESIADQIAKAKPGDVIVVQCPPLPETTTRTIEIPDDCTTCRFNRYIDYPWYTYFCLVHNDEDGGRRVICRSAKDYMPPIKPSWCKVEKITIHERGE